MFSEGSPSPSYWLFVTTTIVPIPLCLRSSRFLNPISSFLPQTNDSKSGPISTCAGFGIFQGRSFLCSFSHCQLLKSLSRRDPQHLSKVIRWLAKAAHGLLFLCPSGSPAYLPSLLVRAMANSFLVSRVFVFFSKTLLSSNCVSSGQASQVRYVPLSGAPAASELAASSLAFPIWMGRTEIRPQSA